VIVDRQGSDVGRWTLLGSRLTGAMGNESESYSDALCLALHAISDLYQNRIFDPVSSRRAERRLLSRWLSSGECTAKFSGPGI
jgi:hypothetical protein